MKNLAKITHETPWFRYRNNYQANRHGSKERGTTMNANTRQIATLLKVTLDEALKVQDYIDSNWLLNWSECSERKFRATVRTVAQIVLK